MITIADLCPYWSCPPTGGGPLRVHNMNKAVAEQVQVLQFSVRPTFGHQQAGWSGWIGTRTCQIMDNYWEYQYFHPAILGTGYALYKAGLHSDIFLSSILEMLSPIALQKIVQTAPIIQVEHPWLFEIAQRLAQGKPIIYVAHNVEAALWEQVPRERTAAHGKLKLRPRELERAAVRHANAIVAMSHQDAQTLVEAYGAQPERITIIPNGVDLQDCRPATSEEKLRAKQRLGLSNQPVLLFTGSDHYPNKEALASIQRWQAQIGPELDVQFVVVGTVGRGVHSTDHMQITGFVENVTPYLQAADISLNPLSSGSGTSLKVVEYLAYGIPTITTETGIRGLELVPGRDVLLGKISEFPKLIRILLQDRALKETLSQQGWQAVQQHYDWKQLGEQMLSIYEKVLPCAYAS